MSLFDFSPFAATTVWPSGRMSGPEDATSTCVMHAKPLGESLSRIECIADEILHRVRDHHCWRLALVALPDRHVGEGPGRVIRQAAAKYPCILSRMYRGTHRRQQTEQILPIAPPVTVPGDGSDTSVSPQHRTAGGNATRRNAV